MRSTNRLLKNVHLLRCPYPSSLRRTSKYASLLRISGALHLGIFEQPAEDDFFSNLLKGIRGMRHLTRVLTLSFHRRTLDHPHYVNNQINTCRTQQVLLEGGVK